jgi:hypothetical protein
VGIYSFEKRFVPFILAGTKKHTIRDLRKYPDKAGNTLHLYQGLRTEKAKLIKRVKCVKIEEISIEQSGTLWPQYTVRIDGNMLDKSECEALARRDGFENFRDMISFWVHPKGKRKKSRLPFRGQIIHWR